MAVTISELVKVVGISKTYLDKRCADEHLNSISRFLDWRTTAPHLGLTETEIEDIEEEDRKNEVRRLKTLQRWKRKCCFKATYRKLVEVFLHIGRADHAEELCIILRSAFSGEQEACCDADVATQLCLPSATPRLSLPGESPIVPRRTGTLEEEIDALERHFLDLVDTTADSCIEANLSLPRLKRCLTQLPVSTKVRHIKFLAGNLVNILKAENIEEIFAILGLYWDFLNCGLLVEMIHKFQKSLPDVKHELQKYLHELRLFRCQTKVKEFIDNWVRTLPPYFGNLTLELDEVWMDRTLEELEEFIKEVCRKHALEPYSVLLKKAESGSVALTGAVQSSFPTKKLSVQISQSFLIQRGVLRVTFRKTCVYRLNIHQVIQVQSLVRMWLARKAYKARLQYFEDCVDAIIKIQAFWRAVRARRPYKQLVKSDKPPASAISRFLALDVLEQVDSDFAEELECQDLKSKVVQMIRSNQEMEQDLQIMDVKIGLLIRNRISLKDVTPTSQRVQPKTAATGQGPPGSPSYLGGFSRASQEKLEGYQHLFYLLQTNPNYFGRLVYEMPSSKVNRFFENIILPVFNYAQNDREHFLLIKFLEVVLKEEIRTKVDKLSDIVIGNPVSLKLVIHYLRGSHHNVLREVFRRPVQDVLDQRESPVQTNPVDVYHGWINEMETQTGEPTKLPYDVSNDQALKHEEVRMRIGKTIPTLYSLSDRFQQAIFETLENIPYSLQYIAMQLRLLLHTKFPDAPEDDILKVVGSLLYYRYMNPCIVAPDAFDIVDVGVEWQISADQRRTLGSVAKVLQHAAACKQFEGETAALSSMNPYIKESFGRFREFFLKASTVESLEEHFNIDEYLDSVMVTKPTIYISVKEIASTHSLLIEHEDAIAPDTDDSLHSILKDLGPNSSIESLLVHMLGGIRDPAPYEDKQDVINEAGKQEIALSLVNKFEGEMTDDASLKALFVRTKQMVIDVLRAQTGDNLTEILYTPATPEQEDKYQRFVHKSYIPGSVKPPLEQTIRQPLSTLDSRLLHIEGVKRVIMRQLRKLEQEGMVDSKNDYQEIVNAIAKDIRNQHRYRQQRKQELLRLQETVVNLQRKASYLEEKLDYYQRYVKACLDNLAKSGVRKRGQTKLETFSYSAHALKLYEKGIFMEIEGLPTHQYRNVDFKFTTTTANVGVLKVTGRFLGHQVEEVELVFQDLLQLEYEGLTVMKMFGRVKVNTTLLTQLLKDKFYS